MVEESNRNVFLIQIDASIFAEIEISEFEISRFDCITLYQKCSPSFQVHFNFSLRTANTLLHTCRTNNQLESCGKTTFLQKSMQMWIPSKYLFVITFAFNLNKSARNWLIWQILDLAHLLEYSSLPSITHKYKVWEALVSCAIITQCIHDDII